MVNIGFGGDALPNHRLMATMPPASSHRPVAFAGGGLFVVLTLFALLLQVGLGGGEGWVLPIGLGVFFSISFVSFLRSN